MIYTISFGLPEVAIGAGDPKRGLKKLDTTACGVRCKARKTCTGMKQQSKFQLLPAWISICRDQVGGCEPREDFGCALGLFRVRINLPVCTNALKGR